MVKKLKRGHPKKLIFTDFLIQSFNYFLFAPKKGRNLKRLNFYKNLSLLLKTLS